jgi:hypothetical protein
MWWDQRAAARRVIARMPAIRGVRYVVIERAGPGAWTPDTAALRRAAVHNTYTIASTPEGENHLSMPLPGLYSALRSAFADFVPDMRHDESLVSSAALIDQYEQRLTHAYGYPVRPALTTMQEVIRRSLNRRNGADAIRTAELAVQYYPDSRAARDALADARKTAAELPPIPAPPASSQVTPESAQLFNGTWRGEKEVRGGMSMKWSVVLEGSGPVWKGTGIAHGVSNEGGDLRGTLPAVIVRGRTLELWTHNCCGGYIVSTLQLQADGSLLGGDEPRHIPQPPGMKPPKHEVIVTMRRAD